MTYEELNVIKRLRKKLLDREQRLAALNLLVESITPPFTRDKDGFTCLDTLPKSHPVESRPEALTVRIAEAEERVAATRAQIAAEIPLLTEKIQREVTDETEQALLIHRYVNCKHFRDIGLAMGFSEGHVYFTHRRILKNLLQENLTVDVSRC